MGAGEVILDRDYILFKRLGLKPGVDDKVRR
jgi:hypothetical protein